MRTARSFVGRERELSELQAGLLEAAGGRGRLFLVAGEPGIGKTRLAEELAATAAERGAPVLWGRCWEGGGAPPYWPWIQAIRALLAGLDTAALRRHLGSGAARVARLIPELHEILPELPQSPAPSPIDSEHARFPLFDATVTFLKNVAGAQPLVLILDDLHAADEPSLLLLQFLARELVTARILVIGTYRAVEAQRRPELGKILGMITRNGNRLPLGGWSEEDVRRFMERVFALEPSPSLVATVYRTTDGNPFFVDEIVRLLVSEGRTELSGLRIPHGVREATRERLRPLSARCRRALEIAAVIGRDFDLACLQRVGSLAPADLLDVVNEAAAASIVIKLAAELGRYGFTHALIRETLYDDLPLPQRVELHRRVAEALEAIHGDHPDSVLTEVAHHFLQAAAGGGVDRAITYAVRAGRQAAALLAHEEAAHWYEQALQVLALRDSPQEAERLDLLLALGEAQARAWHSTDARATFSVAAELARKLDARESFARAALGCGGAGLGLPVGGVVDHALVRLLEEALRGLEPRDSRWRALVLARLAVELYFSDAAERRAALSREAVDIAHRLGDPATLAYAVNARHFALWSSPDVAERMAVANEALRLAEQAGDGDMAIQAQTWRLLDLIEMGATETWEQELTKCARLAEELRQPRYLCGAANLRTMHALWRGRFAEVEALAQQALLIAERVQDTNAAGNVRVQLFVLHRLQGRHDVIEPFARAAVAQLPHVPAVHCMLALVCMDLDRREQTRAELELLAANDFAHLERANALEALIPWLSQICAYLGDTRRAALLRERLLRYGERRNVSFGMRVCFGPASHALAVLATVLNDWAEAERCFEAALDRIEAMAGGPALALAQCDFARMLLCRNAPGDGPRAHDLAAQALQVAEPLGMSPTATRARALLSQAAATPALPETEIRRARAYGGRTHAPAVVDDESGEERAPAGKRGRKARVLSFPAKRGPASPAPQAPAAGAGTGRGSSAKAESDTSAGVFHLEGEYWTVGCGGSLLRLKDTKGLRYIAHLLRHPGREFHALDLATSDTSPAAAAGRGVNANEIAQLGLRVSGDPERGEPLLDAQAKATYKQRLTHLREQLDEATSFNDRERAAALRREIEFLSRELARALGLQGRDRTASSAGERARLNVTRAIRSVIKRIAARNPILGHYLESTIKTGTFCVYVPDVRAPIHWDL